MQLLTVTDCSYMGYIISHIFIVSLSWTTTLCPVFLGHSVYWWLSCREWQ